MNAEPVVYLDSSAIVKLVVHEAESGALRRFLRGHTTRASCALARAEVPRAVARWGAQATGRARQVLAELQLIDLDDTLLDAAGALDAAGLRGLDAIHLTAARALAGDLDYVITYDRRMAAAGVAMGLPVAEPA